MLSPKRPYYNTKITTNILAALPAWMKIHNNDSVGRKFVNASIGTELDLIERNLNVYERQTRIDKAFADTPTEFYQVTVDQPVPSGVFYSLTYDDTKIPWVLGDEKSEPAGPQYKIYGTTDPHKFMTNRSTRLEHEEEIELTNFSGDIKGIEYLNGNPSGYLVVTKDVTPISASSILYYNTLDVDNSVEAAAASGDNMAGYVGLDKNYGYEILKIQKPETLMSKYPSGKWIVRDGVKVDASGINMDSDSPSGHYWYESYVNDDGDKIYRHCELNNPYGSGVYNKFDNDLAYKPISGTIEMYDIMNLDPSGNPYEIYSSGRAVYTYWADCSGHELEHGTWMYKGYEHSIPKCFVPTAIQDQHLDVNGKYDPITATYLYDTSWEILRENGYVDDEEYPHGGTFTWISGSGDLDKTIRFTNGFSNYQAEYSYVIYDSVGQISSAPKDEDNGSSSINGTVIYLDDSSYWQPVPITPSKSDSKAYRTSVLNVRPGNTVKAKVTYNKKIIDNWKNAKTEEKTIQLSKHNMGYTDEFKGF